MGGAALIYWFTQQQKIDRLQAENAQLRAQAGAWAKFWALHCPSVVWVEGNYVAGYWKEGEGRQMANAATPDEAIAALLAKVEGESE